MHDVIGLEVLQYFKEYYGGIIYINHIQLASQ